MIVTFWLRKEKKGFKSRVCQNLRDRLRERDFDRGERDREPPRFRAGERDLERERDRRGGGERDRERDPEKREIIKTDCNKNKGEKLNPTYVFHHYHCPSHRGQRT